MSSGGAKFQLNINSTKTNNESLTKHFYGYGNPKLSYFKMVFRKQYY